MAPAGTISSSRRENKLAAATGSCDCGTNLDSSSGDGDTHHASASCNQRGAHTMDLVCCQAFIQSTPPSDADSSFAGCRAVDCPMRLRVEDAFSCCREDDSDWFDAWHLKLSCMASRRETLLAHPFQEHEPGPKHSQPPSHRAAGPALRPDQKNKRPPDRLRLLSWHPGRIRGSDPSFLASHLNGASHVVIGSLQRPVSCDQTPVPMSAARERSTTVHKCSNLSGAAAA